MDYMGGNGGAGRDREGDEEGDEAGDEEAPGGAYLSKLQELLPWTCSFSAWTTRINLPVACFLSILGYFPRDCSL